MECGREEIAPPGQPVVSCHGFCYFPFDLWFLPAKALASEASLVLHGLEAAGSARGEVMALKLLF